MNAEINNGGPAFPVPGLHADEGFNGMTLRDYFAAKAMQGLIAQSQGCAYTTVAAVAEENARLASAYAYELADAMLLARSQS